MENSFGTGKPFSVGVEEELFLVDPVTGRQANSPAGVNPAMDRAESGSGHD